MFDENNFRVENSLKSCFMSTLILQRYKLFLRIIDVIIDTQQINGYLVTFRTYKSNMEEERTVGCFRLIVCQEVYEIRQIDKSCDTFNQT